MNTSKTIFFLLFLLIIMQAGATYYTYNKFTSFSNAHNDTTTQLLTMKGELTATTEAHEQRILELSDMLYAEQQITEELQDDIKKYDRSVDRLSDTVDDLEKLTTTDSELLQKYSKVYFLNEHYMPADLVVIDEKYDLENGKEVTIHADVWDYLEELLEEAEDDDVDLMVLSGFRSYTEQSTLKGMYTATYGVGANTFSADQGYSEHQLGTAVDFTTKHMGGDLSSFELTEAYSWLLKNAHKYGFTMSYPEGNEYYEYEPWHWRFVGKDLARDLRKEGKYFYDLEQREIDTYLIEIFD